VKGLLLCCHTIAEIYSS